ncbi:MAG: tetratricopeptide repeat protein [bacterium]
MRRISFFIFIVLLYSSISANEGIRQTVDRGLELTYNFQFDQAETIFKNLIKSNPQEPEGYHYLAQIYLWKYLGSKKEESYNIFYEYSEKSIERAEKKLDDNDENAYLNYLTGLIYSLRAGAFTEKGNTLDAFWASKKAVGFFEETLDLNPKFYDAYYGLGLFDYALSFIPAIFKWAVSITGLSSDKDRGFNYLRIAYNKGKYSKSESSFHLAKIYAEYVAEFDSAAIHLRNLINKYPRNILFHYQYGALMIQTRKLDEAEKSLKKVLSINNQDFNQTNSLTKFLMGDIYFRRNKFAEAIKYYDEFLKTALSVDYTGIASYRIAICYEILGDNNNAKRFLLLARNGNTDIFDDSYAKSRSEAHFDDTLTAAEIDIIQAENNLEAGKFKNAIGLIEDLKLDEINDDLKGRVLVMQAEAAFEEKKFKEASKYAHQTFSLELKREQWIPAYGNYLAAKINYQWGKTALAKKYLDEAERMNIYDFSNKISALIHNLDRKLISKKHK